MSVKQWSHGPGARSVGKPSIHPATVDLKGRAYEYVLLPFILVFINCNFESVMGFCFILFCKWSMLFY